MIAIDRIAVQYSIVGNQTMRTLGQENFVAEFHRLQRLTSLDQIGMRFEDRIEFLFGGNCLSLQHPAPRLVDDTNSQGAEIGDLFADGVYRRARNDINLADAFGGGDHLLAVLHHLLGDADDLAVLGSLLLLPLPGGHALDCLHAAAGAARAIGKALDSLGQFLMEVPDQTRVTVRTVSHNKVASVG